MSHGFWHKGRAMNVRSTFSSVLRALLMAFVAGCGKSESTPHTPAVLAPSPDTAIRIHWVGRRWLDLDASAYYVSRVWSLPETKGLEEQTFDKLATNVWHLLLGDTVGSQIPSAALRPLFEDLALEESYFELSIPTNSQTPDWCFAMHVTGRHSGTWVTNLAVAAQFLTGGTASTDPAIHGWTIQRVIGAPKVIVSHLGEWIIVAAGPEKNPLFDDIAERVFHDNALPPVPPNSWIDVDIDLNRAARVFPFLARVDANLARLRFNVTGDGSHVITEGHLTFSNSLSMPIEAWRAPTNLIRQPLLSFTSLRGARTALAKWKFWNDLPIGAPPDQLFFWSLTNSPYHTYVAAPSPTAAHQISVLSDFLLQNDNPWLAKNGYIGFHRSPDSNGVIWGNVSSLTPFIRAADDGSEHWLVAGLMPVPDSKTNAPLPAPINFIQHTNLIYYDWELTGQLLTARLALLQTARQIGRAPQMATDSASLNWLGVLIPRLGPSETIVNQTGSNELAFHRKSTLGLTAIELHLLADWFESPRFPRGLHSNP